MRNTYKRIIDNYLQKRLLSYRAEHHLTQEKMADLLHMDYRSYSNLEHGHNGCSLTTFILFLSLSEKNHNDITQEIKTLITKK